MSEMVERVLEAIRDAVVFSETSGGISIANPEDVSRAAIEAMREPTKPVAKAMIGAMEERIEMFYDPYDPGRHVPDEGDVADVMNAFVDAALKP